MGQNQDKLDGGEQVPSEGPEDTRPRSDSRGAGSHTGDVMEGGSSCEEEAGTTEENLGQPGAQDLDGSPCQEPDTPSSEENVNLRVRHYAAREVRQGGAAGKEGGGGGEGGRAALLAPRETDENPKSRARVEEQAGVYKCYNHMKREESRTEEDVHTIFKSKMEGAVRHEGVRDEDFSAGVSYGNYDHASTSEDANTEEYPAMMEITGCGSRAVREFISSDQRDHKDAITAGIADRDITLCAGTKGRLSERKGPPTAQPLHPLKNSRQKESLSDMSDSIHYRPLKGRTEPNTKEETLTCEVKPDFNHCSPTGAKFTDADVQRDSVRPHLQMDTTGATTNTKTNSNSATNAASPAEPSSILEKLLKRNRTQTALLEVKEDDVHEKDIEDEAARGDTDNAAAELTLYGINNSFANTPVSACDVRGLKDEVSKENLAANDHPNKDSDLNQASDTLDVPCFQPGVIGNTTSPINPHYSISDCQSSKDINSTSVKEEIEEKTNVSHSRNLPSNDKPSAVPHEMSCKVSGMIAKVSVPSPVSEAKFQHTNNGGQVACHLPTSKKTERSAVRTPLRLKPESKGETDQNVSGSGAGPATEAGSILEKSHGVKADIKQDPHEGLHKKNMVPEQPDENLTKESDDSISGRDKSQNVAKSRPVSELIKETIQLHEKLQHQERPKPTELKSDEQGQSVKVAQMKAAFDSAQKSPDKVIERKPSVRKGKG